MKHIVMIDDENDILEIIQSSLELSLSEKVIYHTFSNPLHAVSFIKQQRVDVVISDLNMAKLNGLDVYQGLKLSGNVNNFIFLSGCVDDFKTELSKINNCYILEKPARIDKLTSVVEQCLAKHQSQKERKWFFF